MILLSLSLSLRLRLSLSLSLRLRLRRHLRKRVDSTGAKGERGLHGRCSNALAQNDHARRDAGNQAGSMRG
jgi:hypothetical protein